MERRLAVLTVLGGLSSMPATASSSLYRTRTSSSMSVLNLVQTYVMSRNEAVGQ